MVRPGDIIWTPANAKHWHGATADSAMTHVAIVEAVDGKNVDWMEHVSDQQYGLLEKNACKIPRT
jgi:quercetin dioxygenase-like cupin family protein